MDKGYRFSDWLWDFAVATAIAFGILITIMGMISFILWKLPSPNWWSLCRVSLVIGLSWSLLSALDEMLKRRRARNQ